MGFAIMVVFIGVLCAAFVLLLRGPGASPLTLSQNLFALEFVIIVVPYFAMLLVTSIVVLAGHLASGWLEVLQLLGMILISLGPAACGLRLSWRFLAGGRVALREVHPAWWWGAWLGAITAVATFLIGFMGYLLRAQNLIVDLYTFGLVASPLLVPFLHLLVERRRTHEQAPPASAIPTS